MKKTRQKGFTLIELLVVIGIIIILITILMPAVISALGGGEKGRARTEVKSIEAAIKLYYDSYRRYPLATGTDKEWTTSSGNKDLIETLRGINITENPKKQNFLDVSDSSIATNGTFIGSMLDPWDQPYCVVVDGNYDNSVTVGVAKPGRTVAVWSLGPDVTDNKGDGDDIKSW